MTLTNLKTEVTKTATVASVKLTTPADRIGLGFGAALAYPADNLSQGQFPLPHNPEPEQLRSRQGRSATQMRKQMRTGEPSAVPPAGPAGCLPPGSSADRVVWSVTVGTSWRVTATGDSRNRDPKTCVRLRRLSDCQSQARSDEKHGLTREALPAAAAGK
ncbi:MAG: hypothetical protein J0I06_12845 [Planctomycetes bacterium]|nr:hypothetical protein [Planctomycetota bacterium]